MKHKKSSTSKSKQPIKRCYLCCGLDPDTRDHVPPRGIFPKIPKGQLITVPAPDSCNQKFKQDDELFRNLMIMASYRTAEGRRAWDEIVVPSWDKNRGAKNELGKRMQPVWLRDPNSEALLREHALLVEVDFIRRQIERITRGLFYHRFKEPLPLELQIRVEKYAFPELTLPRWNNFFAQSGIRPKWVHVEPNIFSYFFPDAKENKHEFLIFLIFYNTEFFISF